MRRPKGIYTYIIAVALMLSSGCNSSEELLHPYAVHNTFPKQDFDSSIFSAENCVSTGNEVIDLKRPYKDPDYADYLQSKYAAIMRVTPENIRSLMLYTFIDHWYGVQYRMGGVSKDGIDCSGFAQKLYTSVFGIDLVRTSREQFSSCRFVDKEEDLMEGDLVFFKIRGRRISHVGIYLMNSFFVHSSSNGGVMISSLNEEYYSRRFAGAGYIPKEKG